MPDSQMDPVEVPVQLPYQNPVHAKMQEYSDRMRNLITEAYAEGIVLTTSEMPPLESPLADDQTIYQFMAGVPLMGHVHLNIKTPLMVCAAAVITRTADDQPNEIVPSVAIPKPATITPSAKLIPVRRPESEWCFVGTEFLKPWTQDGLDTSALRFGEKFDLLGVSARDDTNLIDSIDPGITLEAVYYRDAALNVQRIETLRLPYAMFFASVQGNYRDQSIEIALSQNANGEWHTSGSKDGDINIIGTINLQFGNCQLAAHSSKPGLIPLGFTLDAYRSNPNRQGA